MRAEDGGSPLDRPCKDDKAETRHWTDQGGDFD